MVSNETWQRVQSAVRAETGVTIAYHGARRIWEQCGAPAKRHGDKYAATVRRLVNNDWKLPPTTREEAIARVNAVEAERTPTMQAAVDSELERALDGLAGGFTRIGALGFWKGESEEGYVFEVSCTSAIEPRVIELFESAGATLGQTWTHITTAVESAHHKWTAQP